MHGCNHRHFIAVYGFEGGVIARVHIDDEARVGRQFFDVHARTEAFAFGADDDDAHFALIAQAFDFCGQAIPACGVQGIDGRAVDHQFGYAIGVDSGLKLIS